MPKFKRFLIPVVCLLFVALAIAQVGPSAHAASSRAVPQGSSQSQTSAVASVSWAPNRIDYFVVGSDHEVYHQWWNGSSWKPGLTSYEDLRGYAISNVTAVSWAPNRIDLFVVGSNHAVYHKWWNGERWSGWENHGGYAISTISAVPGHATALTCSWWAVTTHCITSGGMVITGDRA